MRPPPTEAAFIERTRPVRLVSRSTAVFGWAERSSTGWMLNFIPCSLASPKLSGRRGSSGRRPSRPATSARSVPWPRPVVAKLPYRPMSASTGISPSSFCAVYPILAAPAVWLEEGPIMTGPRTSNKRIRCTSFRIPCKKPLIPACSGRQKCSLRTFSLFYYTAFAPLVL